VKSNSRAHEPMSPGVASRRRRRDWPFAVAGAIVGLILVLGIGSPGFLLEHVTVCKLGNEVGTYVIWTPLSLLNKPEGTNVSVWAAAWNYTFSSGSLTVGALSSTTPNSAGGEQDDEPGGGIFAGYQNHNWSFYQVVNESVIGTTAEPCTQGYVAELGNPLGCGGLTTVPLSHNSTDTNEPHVWNGTTGFNGSEAPCTVQTPGTYVSFDTSFNPNGTGTAAPVTWNLCNTPGNSPLELLGTARISVVVTVPYQGHDISSFGFLNWYGDPNGGSTGGPNGISEASAFYSVPGGWNWTIAPVGPAAFAVNPASPLPTLVAFERNAC
jgi:hypothetical protein